MRRYARVAVALLAVIALSGCSRAAGTDAPPPGGATATDGSGTGTLGGAGGNGGGSGGGGGGTTPAPPGYPNDAAGYAKAAVAAWASREVNRLNDLEVAGGVLHTLLSCNGCYDIHFALSTCDGAAGSSYCLFFNGVGDELTVRVQNSLVGQPHAVILGGTFEPITFPSDNRAYAQEALDAWLNRNDTRLEFLTFKRMISTAIDGLGANRNSTWTFDHAEGAAGSSYLTWHDTAGHTLTFRFTNGPVAPTQGPASQHRITEILYAA